ncbi:MAG: hydroxymethylbilane synthase [Deltaproteobacteria bacterium]|nr:hydroxymethylbilane synthase [Deltaproteobacteria bacterium]
MTTVTPIIRIGTRGSRLALHQAEWVRAKLLAIWPGLKVELIPIKTSGDKLLEVSLAKVGGKGLFVKEIEEALLTGRADLAVHSVKDLPAELAPGLVLAAVPEREDPRDVLISRSGETLAKLPSGAQVGTSSLRRQALLLHQRPDLRIELFRGNVETRLRKLSEGLVDATVLAMAGLKRLGIKPERAQILDETDFIPAIGQGALGIEVRKDDKIQDLVLPLDHPESAVAVRAERAFLQHLAASCQVPIAARGKVHNGNVYLVGLIISPDGQQWVKGEREGPAEEARQIGATLAAELLQRGGREILEEIGLKADG